MGKPAPTPNSGSSFPHPNADETCVSPVRLLPRRRGTLRSIAKRRSFQISLPSPDSLSRGRRRALSQVVEYAAGAQLIIRRRWPRLTPDSPSKANRGQQTNPGPPSLHRSPRSPTSGFERRDCPRWLATSADPPLSPASPTSTASTCSPLAGLLLGVLKSPPGCAPGRARGLPF